MPGAKLSAVSSDELVQRARQRDMRAIARLMTRAEANGDVDRGALAEIYRLAGRAHTVGITGVPGSGKSTLVARLCQHIRAGGRTVGVVAVDPASPYSGGSILGDRIRMGDLAMDPGVFVRSMSSRGETGGLAPAALALADILDVAGFDVVIIETVGVGQDEFEIASAAQTTVVASAPGLGDDVQAMKAGILETADIHVVTKCDRPDASRTITELKAMLTYSMPASPQAWRVPVVETSAQDDVGLERLLETIDHHRVFLQENPDFLRERQRRMARYRITKAAERTVHEAFGRSLDAPLAELLDLAAARELDPPAASARLLQTLAKDMDNER